MIHENQPGGSKNIHQAGANRHEKTDQWPDSAHPGRAAARFIYRKGAHCSAILYSLVELAKANGLEPYKYLRYIFEKLPFAESQDDFRALLPDRVEL